MKKLLLTACAGAFAAAALLSACKATDTAGNVSAATTTATQTATPPPANPGEARRVTVDELKKMLDAGQAVVYDTRAKTAYDQEHIKGALSMPAGEVESRIGELPKDKTIVFYCTWPNEHTSAGAVLTLKSKGMENAAALLGGMNAWKSQNLPMEGGAANTNTQK